MTAPFLKRLVGALRIPEIRHPAETLLHAVISVGSGQLQCSQNAQGVEQITAHLVLATLAARQGHQHAASSLAARLQRQHAAIFVIRMRRHMHQPGSRAQPAQHVMQAWCAVILWQRLPGRRHSLILGRNRMCRERNHRNYHPAIKLPPPAIRSKHVYGISVERDK